MAANPYIDLLRGSADRYGLDLDLVQAVATQENQTYDPEAVSPKGAVGLMQVMPDTAGDPGYGQQPYPKDVPLADPEANVDFGVGRLKAMMDRYGGVVDHALAAYNQGPGATNKWIAEGSDPAKLPKETRNFISEIKERYEGLTADRVAGPDQPPLYEVPADDAPKARASADNLWGREGKPTAAKEALSALKVAQPKTREEADDSPSGAKWWTDQAEWAAKALYSGVADLGALIVDVADLGFVDDGLTDRFADYVRQHTEDVRESVPEWIKKDLRKQLIGRDENGDIDLNMPNVRQVANLIFESAAPSGAIVGMGAKGFKLLQGISKTKALGQAVAKNPRLAAASAFGTANSAYITAETYTSVYGDVLEEARKTMSLKKAHEEAARSATFAAAIMAPLSFATGAAGEGLAATGKTVTKRLAKGLAGGSVTEFPEEAGQSIAEQLGRGEDVDYVEAANAGVLGMLGAGVTEGAMAAAFGKDIEADYPSPSPEAAAGEQDMDANLPDLPPPGPEPTAGQQLEFDFGDRPEGPSGPPDQAPTLLPETPTETDPAQQSFLTPVTGRVTAAARRAAEAGADSTSDTETPDQASTRPVAELEVISEPSPTTRTGSGYENTPLAPLELARAGHTNSLRGRLVRDAALTNTDPRPFENIPDEELLTITQDIENAVDIDSTDSGELPTTRERDNTILERVTARVQQLGYDEFGRRGGVQATTSPAAPEPDSQHQDEINAGMRTEDGELTLEESAQRIGQLRATTLAIVGSSVEAELSAALTAGGIQSYEDALDMASDVLETAGMSSRAVSNTLDRIDRAVRMEADHRLNQTEAAGEDVDTAIADELAFATADTAIRDALDGLVPRQAVSAVARRARQIAIQKRLADPSLSVNEAMVISLEEVLMSRGTLSDAVRSAVTHVREAIGLPQRRPRLSNPADHVTPEGSPTEQDIAMAQESGDTPENEQRYRLQVEAAEVRQRAIAAVQEEAGKKFLPLLSEAVGREVTQDELNKLADKAGDYDWTRAAKPEYRAVMSALANSRNRGSFGAPRPDATVSYIDEAVQKESAKKLAKIMRAVEEVERGAFTLTNVPGNPTTGFWFDSDVSAAVEAEHKRRGEPMPDYANEDVQVYRSKWIMKPLVEGGAIEEVFDSTVSFGGMHYEVVGPIAYVHAVDGMSDMIPRQRGHGHKPILQAMEQLVKQDLVVYADDQVSRNASRVAGMARQQGYDIEVAPDVRHDEDEMDYGAFRASSWAFRMTSLPEGGQLNLMPTRREDRGDPSLALPEENQPLHSPERSPWTPELPRQRDIRTNRTVAIRMTPRQAKALSELISRGNLLHTLMAPMSPEFRAALDDAVTRLNNDIEAALEEVLANESVPKTYADYKLAAISSLSQIANVAEGNRSELVDFPVSIWPEVNELLTTPDPDIPATDNRPLQNVRRRLAQLQPSYVAGGPLTQMGAAMRPEPRPDTLNERTRDPQMHLNLSGTQDPNTGRELSVNQLANQASLEEALEPHFKEYDQPTEGPTAENMDETSDNDAVDRAAAEAEAARLEESINLNTYPDRTPSDEHSERLEEYLHGQVGAAESDAYWQGRDAADEGGGGRGGGGFRGSDTFRWFRQRWRRFKQAHWDQWVRDAQDAQIAIERLQRVLKDHNGLVADRVQLHEAWTRLPAAVVDRITKMEQAHLAPLLNVAAGNNVDGVANQNWEAIDNATVNKFIASLHSIPRNYFIAKRNGEPAPAPNEAGGSGVSVNAALANIAEIEAAYPADQLAALEDQVFQLTTALRSTLGERTVDNPEGSGLIGSETMDKWVPDEDFKAAYNNIRDTQGYAAALDFANYGAVTNPDGSTMTHEQWQDNLHKVTYVPLFDVAPEHTLSKLLHDVQWARDDFSSEASIFGNEVDEAHGRMPDRGLAQDSLSHLVVNMQTAIARGQRNRTLARRTINLIRALNPTNQDNRIGYVLPEAPAGTYADGQFLRRQIELHRPRGDDTSPTQFPPGYTPPIVRYKKGNTEVAAIIYDVRLAEALMTRQSEESQSKVVNAFLGLSSLTRRAMTTLSPGFIGVNIFREGINARIQAMSIPGIPREALAEIAKTINPKTVAQWSKEYYDDTKDPTANVHDELLPDGTPNPEYIADDTQRYHREIIRYLKEAGMPSLLFKSFDPRDVKADLQKSLDAVTSAGTPTGALKAFGRAFGKLAQFSEDVANATENGVRAQVAAGVYKHFMGVAHADLLSQHPESVDWSQERKDAWLKRHHNAAMNHAANAGQNLSVNFQRFGKKTRGLNRLFFFLNATIQGSTRVFKQGGVKRLGMLAARLGSYGAASTLLNYLIAGEDDEGRSLYEMNVPQWVREHNMVVMIPFSGGQYVAIPLPYGFNFMWGTGEAAMSAVLTADDRNMTKTEAFTELPGQMLDLAMNSFTPVPSQAKANPLRLIAPSMLEPWVDLAQNKDWRGIPIVPPGASYLTTDAPPPDAFNVRDPDPDGSLEYITRTASRWMNRFFGGNEYRAAGFGDVNPNTIEHLVKSYTGGAGMLAFRTLDSVALAASGEAGEAARSAPVVRRFYGLGESRYDDRDRYNKLRTELLRVDGERKGLIAAGDSAGMKNFMHTDGDLYSSGVIGSLKRTENQVRKWARMRNKIRRIPNKTQSQKDRLEALDDRITQLMVNFNTYYYDKLVEEEF